MTGRGTRAFLWWVVAAGCGRIDFAARPDGTGTPGVDTSIDMGPAVCGDGVCAGQQGELCATCSDCVTLSAVCGNGACEAGETGVCYADCGPAPWPGAWQTEAMDLLTAANQARATGVMCPGTSTVMTAPALVYDVTYEPTAREWAWEAAHENWIPADACNGRTALQRVTTANAASIWKVFAASSPSNAIAMLLADATACPNVMTASNTKLGAAAAHDLITSHAVVFR